MAFAPAPLPYPDTALAPYISQETIQFHYGKHHHGYATKLNLLTKDRPEANMVSEANGGAAAHESCMTLRDCAVIVVWRAGGGFIALSRDRRRGAVMNLRGMRAMSARFCPWHPPCGNLCALLVTEQ